MKKKLFSLLVVLTMAFFVKQSNAQVSVGVHINIGDQPGWGPAGYNYAEYYYLPDIETYYCVPRREFVYLSGGRWIFSPWLPPAYANYDLYSGYKVVLRTPYAYRYFNHHRVQYAGYRNCYSRQAVIMRKHDNGNHYGQYKNRWKYDNDGWKGNGRGRGRH